jgi:nucleoside-diphosphate-sugar epimerase
MTYLVTGGTGFIGSRIVRNLVREGEQVVVFDWAPDQAVLPGCSALKKSKKTLQWLKAMWLIIRI